jgi:hypothetical protein
VSHTVEDRLWALAVGIRPSFALECGVESRGTVDILDSEGIAGWRFGLGQLIADLPEPRDGGDQLRELSNWARTELDADRHRWEYLDAYVRTFASALAGREFGATEEAENERFWRGWQRNMAFAHGSVSADRLVVSPRCEKGLHGIRRALSAVEPIAAMIDQVERIQAEASIRVQATAADPPELVLSEYRPALTAALKRTGRQG